MAQATPSPVLRSVRTLIACLALLTVGASAAFMQQPPPAEKSAEQPSALQGREPKDDEQDAAARGLVLQLGPGGLSHGHNVHGVAFAPDGKTLASAGWDHLARQWDARTGEQVRSFGTKAERMNP